MTTHKENPVSLFTMLVSLCDTFVNIIIYKTELTLYLFGVHIQINND